MTTPKVPAVNPYHKLTINTLLLSIGTIGTKAISFLMTRFYTSILNTAEYGIKDLMENTVMTIIPIVTLGISAGIVRFGLDKHYKKTHVLTTAFFCLAVGYAIALLFAPLLSRVAMFEPYIFLLYLYLLAASFRLICLTFVRANEFLTTFAINGIFNACLNVLLMFVFLKWLSMGLFGYLLAVIGSDFLATMVLFVPSKMWRKLDFRRFPPIAKPMILYSLPLVLTTINWSIITNSDRFMIAHFHGADAAGIYSLATKIPMLVTLLAGVFIDAWHISIIGTQTRKEQTRFFNTIMRSYQALLFVMASGLILVAKPLIIMLSGSSAFHEAWRYVPFVVSATVFSCLANFVGTVYTLHKKSVALMGTALLAGATNLLLNFLLIPKFGAAGGAFATLVSFVLMFFFRIINAKKLLHIRFGSLRFGVSFGVLIIQCLLLLLDLQPVWIGVVLQILFLILLSLLNLQQLFLVVRKVLDRKARQN